jgi:hypothetical protein
MKLEIFNVGRGNAALVTLEESQDAVRVGIIDCFQGRHSPLLSALRKVPKRRLSIEFLVITHYHADHFVGVAELLREFGSAIRLIADPGLDLGDVQVAEFGTSTRNDGRARRELRALTAFKRKHPAKVRSVAGPGQMIFDAGGLTVRSVAPDGLMLTRVTRQLRRHVTTVAKRYAEGTMTDDVSATGGYDLNQTSSAVLLEMGGYRFLFGGDVLTPTWNVVAEAGQYHSDVFVMSHHGADNAFAAKTIAKLARPGMRMIVSGAGRGQPAPSVVRELRSSAWCGGVWATNVPRDASLLDGDDWLLRFHYGAAGGAPLLAGDVLCLVETDIVIDGPRIPV